MERQTESLSKQMKKKISEPPPPRKSEYDGNFGTVISTGSTLLDLAISGGRIRGGGLPGGVFVEAFGPAASGKTVLLSEIAGAVQRQGGDIVFADPESRLNEQFAKIFGVEITDKNHSTPDTVTEIFQTLREWKPQNNDVVNGFFADSLAALSTDMEMDNDEGDKMGGRRSKEFSEQLRKSCRIIKDKNYLLVCSNQIREVMNATKWEQKTKSTGGRALEHYPSLRLQFSAAKEIKDSKKIAGKDVTRTIGVETQVKVFKNSIWKAYHIAPLTIIFDYGIDDVTPNLQFIKDYTASTVYTLGGEKLSNGMEESVKMIESNGWEDKLREEVINLWEEIESKFATNRKPKR
jgi:protein RecA